MKIMKLITIALLTISSIAVANNVQVNNVILEGKNTTGGYTTVKFDISWDNSWRIKSNGPFNWDASWIFVKYRLKNTTEWKHATLEGDVTQHTKPSGAELSSSPDNKGITHGVFIHRDATAISVGNVNYTGVGLIWKYRTDGLSDDDNVEICVFAIEMVYVPEGSFYLGSGGAELNHFYRAPTITSTYQIKSEASVVVGENLNNLYYPNNVSAFKGDQKGPIPTLFPKGFKAFYCMKYEITQDQYASFLNKLSIPQATSRGHGGKQENPIYNIEGNPNDGYTSNGPAIACNLLSWADLAAYLDWAALRPMTELEFVKVSRGTERPVPNEYGWGTTNISTAEYTLRNVGKIDENIASNYSITAGNALYNATAKTIGGQTRVGIFASHSGNTGRETAGSSYYGAMELGGNLWERCITINSPEGRAFQPKHGNGELTTAGIADVSTWPSSDTAIGIGQFGGSYIDGKNYLRTSDRAIASQIVIGRSVSFGGRGVRTAP